MYKFWFVKLLSTKTIRTPIVNYKQKESVVPKTYFSWIGSGMP